MGNEILTGLTENFTTVSENIDAHVVFSSQKPVVIDLSQVSSLATKNADDANMTVYTLENILVNGFVDIDVNTLSGSQPIVEHELFTEFYLKPFKLMSRAIRVSACLVSGRDLDGCKAGTRL